MFIIIGSSTSVEHEKPLLDTYCYHCNRETTWDLYAEKHWVTFFFIRTFVFRKEHFLVCEHCRDHIDLTREEGRQVARLHRLTGNQSQELHDRLVKRIEQKQMGNKTEQQLNYIKSLRENK